MPRNEKSLADELEEFSRYAQETLKRMDDDLKKTEEAIERINKTIRKPFPHTT